MYVVPVLLVIGIAFGLRIYFRRKAESLLLKWNLYGTSVGLIAEITVIAMRFNFLLKS